MIAASYLIDQVARYLSDLDSTEPEYSFTTWSKEDLRHYLRMAVASVFAARPGKFAKRHFLEGPGPFIDLHDGCTEILSVLGIQWADGSVTTNARIVRKRRDIPTTSMPLCDTVVSQSGPTVVSVTVDPATPNALVVDPPLPRGAKLVVMCATMPNLDGENLELDPTLEPLVFNWMLAYAFGTETESGHMRQRADVHWTRGADLLGLNAAAAQQLRTRAQA